MPHSHLRKHCLGLRIPLLSSREHSAQLWGALTLAMLASNRPGLSPGNLGFPSSASAADGPGTSGQSSPLWFPLPHV